MLSPPPDTSPSANPSWPTNRSAMVKISANPDQTESRTTKLCKALLAAEGWGEGGETERGDLAPGSRQTLFWQLVRQNSELVDLGRLGKQVAGLGFFHQRRRHLAVEMRVAPGLVVERVEDGER